ncbi:hypothetical protein AB0K43_00075 [Kitasatospora sp. NPDC049258]|uniref:hypothetical protein n=1 Tax=Kitasatospora sp. NPDC049258 TaxID=3155394 RepID=UPI00343412B4
MPRKLLRHAAALSVLLAGPVAAVERPPAPAPSGPAPLLDRPSPGYPEVDFLRR